jgi:SAM-dependent methyltransferase
VTFEVMDAEHLTFPDASFDVICGSGILHHLDLARANTEIARCLAPQGEAVFVEPLGHNPAINAYRRFTPGLRTPDEHPLRMADFAAMRRSFGDVDVRYYALAALAAVPLRNRPSFPKMLERLEHFDATLFRRVPAVRRYAWYSRIVLRDPIADSSCVGGAGSG